MQLARNERTDEGDRKMTTVNQKRMSATWLFWLALVFAIGLWSKEASAYCEEQPDQLTGFYNCWPNHPPDNTWHSYTAVIGTDPTDNNQWIGWFDETTGQCDGW